MKTNLTSIAYVTAARADLVAEAIVQSLWPYRDLVHTPTSDNGKKLTLHKSIAEAFGAEFFFAHPYSSWEGGLNENTDGLIRQYFPKNAPFGTRVTRLRSTRRTFLQRLYSSWNLSPPLEDER